MSNVRKQILQKLEDELPNIKIVNGYNSTIKNVYNGFQNPSSELSYPSVAFAYGNDVVETELEQGQIRSADLFLIGYVSADIDENKTGKLSDVIENLFQDLYKFVYLNSSLNSIDNLIEIKVTEKNSYLSGLGTNKTVISMILKCIYLEDNISELQNSGAFTNTAE